MQYLYLDGNELSGCIPGVLRDQLVTTYRRLVLPFCE